MDAQDELMVENKTRVLKECHLTILEVQRSGSGIRFEVNGQIRGGLVQTEFTTEQAAQDLFERFLEFALDRED